jgi:hypothetical protein
MVSKISQTIMEDVDGVSNSADIESLLQKYQKKPQKDFIQKYAETKIAVNSSKVTILAYLFALMAVIAATILSISLTLNAEYYKEIRIFSTFMVIALIIVFILTLILFILQLSKKDILEDIIIAVQDDKLAIQESVDSIVIPKLNEINGKVEAINPNAESQI